MHIKTHLDVMNPYFGRTLNELPVILHYIVGIEEIYTDNRGAY